MNDKITNQLTADLSLLNQLGELASYRTIGTKVINNPEAALALKVIGLVTQYKDGWRMTDKGFFHWRWHPIMMEAYYQSKVKA